MGEINHWVSMFFVFGVVIFFVFNATAVTNLAQGFVNTGVSLSKGLGTIGQGTAA